MGNVVMASKSAQISLITHHSNLIISIYTSVVYVATVVSKRFGVWCLVSFVSMKFRDLTSKNNDAHPSPITSQSNKTT